MIALAIVAWVGCREKAPAPVAQATAPAPVPQPTAGRSDAACVAPLDAPGAKEKVRAAKGEVRIGVLAGLKDADDENLGFIKRLVAEFVQRGAEVLIAD